MNQVSQSFGESHKDWKDHGHWMATKIKEVDILYAIKEREKITFVGESQRRDPVIEDFRIPKRHRDMQYEDPHKQR